MTTGRINQIDIIVVSYYAHALRKSPPVTYTNSDTMNTVVASLKA